MTMNEKLLLVGIVGVAGAALYSLTRKPVTPVVTPVTPVVTPVTPPVKRLVAIPPLDTGLTAMEVKAVQNAITAETLPGNLAAFAASFEPMFPVAASLLRNRAAALQGGGTMTGARYPLSL